MSPTHAAPAAALLAATLALATPRAAHATTYALTRADRTEITQLLRAFFEATRDGNATGASATLPTQAEFRALFPAGAEPLLQRHQRAIERDVRELRTRFARGTWVGLSGSFTRDGTVEIAPCARFATPGSECTGGPVIDWRVDTTTQHLRIDALVRINGHWRIFDPRL